MHPPSFGDLMFNYLGEFFFSIYPVTSYPCALRTLTPFSVGQFGFKVGYIFPFDFPLISPSFNRFRPRKQHKSKVKCLNNKPEQFECKKRPILMFFLFLLSARWLSSIIGLHTVRGSYLSTFLQRLQYSNRFMKMGLFACWRNSSCSSKMTDCQKASDICFK